MRWSSAAFFAAGLPPICRASHPGLVFADRPSGGTGLHHVIGAFLACGDLIGEKWQGLSLGLLLTGKSGALAAGIVEGMAGRFDEAHGSLSIRIFGGKRLDLGLDAAQIGDFLLVARCLGPLKIVGKA